MGNYNDLKRLKYLLEICLQDHQTVNSVVEDGLNPYSVRSNEYIATQRINDLYIMHRDNFKELMSEISNIKIDIDLFENSIKEAKNKLKTNK